MNWRKIFPFSKIILCWILGFKLIFRGFKSALSLEFIESKLKILKEEEEKEEGLIAEMAVAAVLIGGSGKLYC